MQRIRLHQHPLQLHMLQQRTEGRDLSAFVGGVSALGVAARLPRSGWRRQECWNRCSPERCRRSRPEAITLCARSVLGDGAPECLAVADQGVDGFGMAELGTDPVSQQTLKALKVQLGQQQAECGIRWRLQDVRAETVVQHLAMALLLRRSLAARANLSMPISEPWLLRMARIATRSIHHWGKRMPRRMRQSGRALRKLIRSVAAAGFSRKGTKG
jgi:hypothetical protein